MAARPHLPNPDDQTQFFWLHLWTRIRALQPRLELCLILSAFSSKEMNLSSMSDSPNQTELPNPSTVSALMLDRPGAQHEPHYVTPS